MLADNRCADYVAERLTRSFVGVEKGQFIIFRRDRFVRWLSNQLKDRMPYDQIVRDMISARGLWTDVPATNFITVGFANDEFDASKLTGRVTCVFLGQRIDCAQCHNHSFEGWTQRNVQCLAAYFAEVKLSPVGVQDSSDVEFKVPPQVPFHPEWPPEKEHGGSGWPAGSLILRTVDLNVPSPIESGD